MKKYFEIFSNNTDLKDTIKERDEANQLLAQTIDIQSVLQAVSTQTQEVYSNINTIVQAIQNTSINTGPEVIKWLEEFKRSSEMTLFAKALQTAQQPEKGHRDLKLKLFEAVIADSRQQNTTLVELVNMLTLIESRLSERTETDEDIVNGRNALSQLWEMFDADRKSSVAAFSNDPELLERVLGEVTKLADKVGVNTAQIADPSQFVTNSSQVNTENKESEADFVRRMIPTYQCATQQFKASGMDINGNWSFGELPQNLIDSLIPLLRGKDAPDAKRVVAFLVNLKLPKESG